MCPAAFPFPCGGGRGPKAGKGQGSVLDEPEHVVALPGSTTADHARENARALSVELSADQFSAIDRASSPCWR